MVNDRPGVLSELTGILADEGISISTMVQDDPTPTGGSGTCCFNDVSCRTWCAYSGH